MLKKVLLLFLKEDCIYTLQLLNPLVKKNLIDQKFKARNSLNTLD